MAEQAPIRSDATPEVGSAHSAAAAAAAFGPRLGAAGAADSGAWRQAAGGSCAARGPRRAPSCRPCRQPPQPGARRGGIGTSRRCIGPAAARAEGGRRPAGRSRRGRGAGGAGRPAGAAFAADHRRLRAPLRGHRRQPGARARGAAAVAGAAHAGPLPGDRARGPQLCQPGQRGALHALGAAGRADRPARRGGAVWPHAAACCSRPTRSSATRASASTPG